MCLGVPGRIVEMSADHPHLATADIKGVRRQVNIGLVQPEGAAVGDWILVHMGMAMEILDEEAARSTLEFLESLAGGWDDSIPDPG